MVVIFLGGQKSVMEFGFIERLLMWLPKSWVLFIWSYAFILSGFLHLCFISQFFKKGFINNFNGIGLLLTAIWNVWLALHLRRSQPYGAALWLPWEDEPNAQLHIQLWEGCCENMAPPRWELWTKKRWDWRHDRWHAALWSYQHGRLQHPRAAHKTGANRTAGCCGVFVCRHTGVGWGHATCLPVTHYILKYIPVDCPSWHTPRI